MTFPRRPHRPVRVVRPARAPKKSGGGCLTIAIPIIAALAAALIAIAK